MATLGLEILFVFFSFFFLLDHILQVATATTCGGSTCTVGGPLIRFPFQLSSYQASTNCGYPGFNLSCNTHNQTILTLPNSGDFIVQRINYKLQTITVNDPNNCLPQRFLHHDISLKHSPFLYDNDLISYTFVACSSLDIPYEGWSSAPVIISCLTDYQYRNKAVVIVPSSWFLPPVPVLVPVGCSVISKAWIPSLFNAQNLYQDLGLLTWHTPDCRSCGGNVCELVNGTRSQIQCSDTSKSVFSNLPRAAKYGIVVGVGIPGLLCLIGLTHYICDKRRTRGQLHRPSMTELISTLPNRQPLVRLGLDDQSIEQYPNTQLGETWELPKPNGNTCSICLCDYKPKETLRCIPECNHYFHANCVDEWLRMNATCPLCRNPQEAYITI